MQPAPLGGLVQWNVVVAHALLPPENAGKRAIDDRTIVLYSK
jgi:hypothetical protein